MAESLNKRIAHVDSDFALRKGYVYEEVSSQLLKEVETVYKEKGKLTDEVLSALQCVFQASLLPALDLVDKRSVSRVICPAGRSLYQVVGSSGTPYTCFTSSVYCPCPAYRYSVLLKEEHMMCKHLLAIKLSEAIGCVKILEVSNQDIANMIQRIE